MGGVKGFTKVYGGRDRRRTTPKHFSRSAKGVIRYCLIQLQKLGLVATTEEGKRGRVITSEGQKLLDTIARRIDMANNAWTTSHVTAETTELAADDADGDEDGEAGDAEEDD